MRLIDLTMPIWEGAGYGRFCLLQTLPCGCTSICTMTNTVCA